MNIWIRFSDVWNIGGDVTVKEDTKMTSSTVGGNGVLRMMGDLMVSIRYME